KPNPTPAPLPNAKCGKRAVPPETGYIAPSSAWARARTMTTTPAMTQSRTAAPPTRVAAPSGAKSQPEPMMDVSDAHAAPISPNSRFRPVWAGVVWTAVLSVAMIDSSFRFSIVPEKGMPRAPRVPLGASERSVVQSDEHVRDPHHV